MNYNIVILTILAIFLPAQSCEKNKNDDLPGDPVPIELSAVEKILSEKSNSFSFDIFRVIADAEEEKDNLMISPLSISYALTMTLNGAAGATRDSMMKALRINDMNLEDVNNSYLSLTEKVSGIDPRVVLNIANSVWIEERLDVKQAFIDALYKYFQAEAHNFDINDPDIVDKVNLWISDNTNGLIKDMVREIPDEVVMLLINAIYFDGKWRYQFDTSLTGTETFYISPGTEVDADMMSVNSNYPVLTNDDLILAELPYGQGNFVMDVILPAPGKDHDDILPLLTEENWVQWTASMSEREVNLFMPRFKYSYRLELKDVLSAMGMSLAFSRAADFSNIADDDLNISKVIHQSFIDNREEGTEAAAATVVMIELTSVNPSGPLTIRLDRPFYYIIREKTTGTIIFMGLTGDPSVS